MIEADEIQVSQDGKIYTIVLPKAEGYTIGVYLFSPSREPRAVYAVNGLSSFKLSLLAAVADYFQVDGCNVAK